MENRPKIGGFPFLAECLRKAGVEKNIWTLPAAQSTYVMKDGAVVNQGTPLATGIVHVSSFNQDALIAALRKDQSGQGTFPEFLQSAWDAGVIRYDVDFIERTVTYMGAHGEQYVESYEHVDIGNVTFDE